MSQNQSIIDRAKSDARKFGGSVRTMVFVDYVNENDESVTRVFQIALADGRREYIKLTSWCLNNNRIMRVTPFSMYGQDA